MLKTGSENRSESIRYMNSPLLFPGFPTVTFGKENEGTATYAAPIGRPLLSAGKVRMPLPAFTPSAS
jgi:hypothetical protein